MAQHDNIVSFSHQGRSAVLSGKAIKAIAESRHVVERALPKLMTGLFEKLDDALYELADKSESNQLQTAYFDAMRAVRRQRRHIHAGFVEGVLADFDGLWTEGPRDLSPEQSESGQDDTGLSLVDDEELEQSLAVSNLVSKGDNRYQRELFNLGRRFGMLIGVPELQANANPIGPAAICNRFHLTIRDLAVDTPVLLVIYKLFDKQVMNYVGGLYEEINALLTRAGFVPKVQTKGYPQPEVPADNPHHGAALTAMPPTSEQVPPAPGYRPAAGRVNPPPAYAPAPGQPQAPAGYASPGGMRPVQPETGGAPAGYGPPGAYPASSGYAPAAPVPGASPVPPGGEAPAQMHADVGQAGFFSVLQDLLAGYRSSVGQSLTSMPMGLPVVATPELIGALSTLQRIHLESAHEGVAAQGEQFDLRGRLTNALDLERNGKANRSLGKADDDTIDVIAMLFEFLLGDPNLPDAMKALIARLQIPMLKVALMDKDFFSRKLHPARRLLNNLARAALGWTDEDDRSEKSLYGRIESVVNRVVDGFEDDPTLFDDLNDEFSAYMERERRGAEIAEERTNQVTRGKEQLRVAKRRVTDEITHRLAGYPRVPLVARTMLEDAWKDVLLLAYLRQGPGSDAWKDGLDIVDRLLHSVAPRSGYAERQELLRTIPELLRGLREGLTGISYDQHKMARLFKELQSCHIACLRGVHAGPSGEGLPENFYSAAKGRSPKTGTDAPGLPDELDEDSAIRLAALEDGGTIEHDQHTDQAENLKMGTWLELQEEDGRTARIKLSWKSDVSDAYVFVNRKGVKVLEMTMVGVAKLFRAGSARVLQQVDTPIMDKAMDAMIETLKSVKTAAG